MGIHPFISRAGSIAQMIKHLRVNFPARVTWETVRDFGIAPSGERNVVSVLQFLGIIDEQGNRTQKGNVLTIRDEMDFRRKFESLIRYSYSDLFDAHGERAWTMGDEEFVRYFRETDRTGMAIGRGQARVFQILSRIAGHGQIERSMAPRTSKNESAAKWNAVSLKVQASEERQNGSNGNNGHKRHRDSGVTVRIEIHLPPNGTEATYDKIFKTIKGNFGTIGT